MENAIEKKDQPLKYGSVIKPLSIIALVCTVLSCVADFFYYDSQENNGKWIYELSVRPLNHWNLESIFSLISTLAPVILFMLYLFKFRSKLKANVLIPIIFGVFCLNTIHETLFNFFGWSSSGLSLLLSNRIYRIFDLARLVCSILAVISALKGFCEKSFVIISMAVSLLYETLFLTTLFLIMETYIEHSMYLYIFASLLSIIGASTLYTSLLLFGLKNKIPSDLSLQKEKAEIENPRQALIYGSTIKPLLIIALVCTALGCMTCFIHGDSGYINGEWVYRLYVSAYGLESIPSHVLTLASIILFVLYVSKFYGKLKAATLVPISLSVLCFNVIFNLLFGYSYRYVLPRVACRILDLIMLVCLILAVISSLKGFSKKAFIISISACLLCETFSLIAIQASYPYILDAGTITLYTAVLLFGLKNKIPPILSPAKEKVSAEKMNPEQELKLLKNKRDLDMITEEEYQVQRADIISKL